MSREENTRVFEELPVSKQTGRPMTPANRAVVEAARSHPGKYIEVDPQGRSADTLRSTLGYHGLRCYKRGKRFFVSQPLA